MKDLFNAVALSHQLIESHVKPGMTVIDATCGNGNDTIFLSKRVGPAGKVYSFDIQTQAIKKAKALAEKESLSNIRFFLKSHEYLAELVTCDIDCVVFNLGYLPSSDSNRSTKARSTVKAFHSALKSLSVGGVIVCCAYVSHCGGMREFRKLIQFLRRLDAAKCQTMVFEQPNQIKYAPKVIFVRKKVDF